MYNTKSHLDKKEPHRCYNNSKSGAQLLMYFDAVQDLLNE